MILSDAYILAEIRKGTIGIEPFTPDNVQPASVDLTLDHRFLRLLNPHPAGIAAIDPKSPEIAKLMTTCEPLWDRPFSLYSGEFALGSTVERVKIPDHMVGRLDGKSSLGRLGLFVHATAGYVDPGWDGQLTLEFFNASPIPIWLHPGMRICQISFQQLSSPANRPYGGDTLNSKYQGQEGPVASQYWRNYETSAPDRDVT